MKVSTISSYSLMAALVLASAAANEAVTPAPTSAEQYYDEQLGCWPISVEHDATYCIEGPICSGSGPSPAGSLCPVKGDVAIADCHSYLASFTGGDSCALPVDATCQVIKTGAWGCVTSGSSSYPTPAPSNYGNGGGHSGGTGTGGTGGTGGNGGGAGSGSLHGNGSAAGNETISLEAGTEAASSGGVSAGVIAAVAAAAAAVAAVAGVAIYRQHAKMVQDEEEEMVMVDVVTP